MRVLLTQNSLLYRGGSELFLVDVARALLRRGHEPTVFTSVLGQIADDLRAANIPVVDRLDSLPHPPDIIHGQHHLEALQALLHFPEAPAIHVSHGVLPWQEAPLVFPRITRYVAVSDLIRDRLVSGYGIPAAQVDVLLNFADLERFRSRTPPLPVRPRRALILSNGASEATHVPEVRRACASLDIALDVVGIANGNPTTSPETLLPKYDLVFARGRAAIEALVVGAAVVLCDVEGHGPLVRLTNLDRLRRLNFAIGTFVGPCTAENLAAQIAAYDPVDASRVSARMREQAGLEAAMDRLLGIYEDGLRMSRSSPPPSLRDERRAIIEHARRLSVRMLHHGRGEEWAEAQQLIQRIAAERAAIERERETYVRDREEFLRVREQLLRAARCHDPLDLPGPRLALRNWLLSLLRRTQERALREAERDDGGSGG